MTGRQPLPHIRREQKRVITPHRTVPLRHATDPVKNPQNPHADTPASPPRFRDSPYRAPDRPHNPDRPR
jgi:hypothetical protein